MHRVHEGEACVNILMLLLQAEVHYKMPRHLFSGCLHALYDHVLTSGETAELKAQRAGLLQRLLCELLQGSL